MIFYVLALVFGVVGGVTVGACVHGRRRLPVFWLWLALPLVTYTVVMFWGGIEGRQAALEEAVAWWLIGLLGYPPHDIPPVRWDIRVNQLLLVAPIILFGIWLWKRFVA